MLVEAQVLKSELDIHVTGGDVFNLIIERLSLLSDVGEILTSLNKISHLLSVINNISIGTSNNIYLEIIDEIRTLDIPFDEKFLFQTDLFKPTYFAELDNQIVDNVSGVLSFLNRITPQKKIKENLTDFKKKFYARYEEEEVSLVEALDPDFGIGYGHTNTDLEFNVLIKDIVFPVIDSDNRNEPNLSYYYAHKIQAAGHNYNEIVLTEELVDDVVEDWSLSSDSLTVSVTIFNDNDGEDLILLNGIWFGATNI
jgi:hypothetical protein